MTTSLRYLADVRVSNVDKKAVEGEPAVRICNYTDVYHQNTITADLDFMQATATRSQILDFGLRSGDTIITKDSETADDIGVPAFVPTDLPGVVCGYHLALIRPRSDLVDPRYLGWVMQSEYARAQLEVNASGVTRYGLTYGAIQSVEIPDNKTVAEQRRIADFLDDQVARIDEAILVRRSQAVLHRERFRSLVEEATGSTTAARIRLKWVVDEVDDRADREPEQDDLLAVSIHHGVVPRSQLTDDPPRAATLMGYKRVRQGDVVLNRMRAFQGGAGVARTAGIVSPDYAVLRPRPEAHPNYLNYLFRAPWFVGEMTSRLRGIGGVELGTVRTPRVNVDDLLNTEVSLPSRDVQAESAAELDQVADLTSKLGEAADRSVSLLQERKRSLITAAVMGELDVSSSSSSSLRAAEAVVGS